jgi:hypothetical protein
MKHVSGVRLLVSRPARIVEDLDLLSFGSYLSGDQGIEIFPPTYGGVRTYTHTHMFMHAYFRASLNNFSDFYKVFRLSLVFFKFLV